MTRKFKSTVLIAVCVIVGLAICLAGVKAAFEGRIASVATAFVFTTVCIILARMAWLSQKIK
jgi:hypothetical protein